MKPQKIICIGGSAGSITTLFSILSALPAEFPIPIVILIHQQTNRQSNLVSVFQKKSLLPVSTPEDMEQLEQNHIYIAPPMYHLQVEKDKSFSFSLDEPVHFSRPSIDVLFETIAKAFGPHATGIILSGASEDGSDGVKWIEKMRGKVLIQNIQEAEYKTMVKAAHRISANNQTYSEKQIINYILSQGGN